MHLTNATIVKLKQHIISLNGPCNGFEIHAMQRVTGREFGSYFTEEGFSLTRN
jgi:hypothetical protein